MSARSKSVSIPVKVEKGPKRRTPRVVQPTPPKQPKPAAQPRPKSTHPLRQPVHELPDHHRKRLMWGIVAVAMFFIMIGWAMTLGYELDQDNREVGLLRQLSSIFRSFDPTSSGAEANGEEIRSLEEQVFPQF